MAINYVTEIHFSSSPTEAVPSEIAQESFEVPYSLCFDLWGIIGFDYFFAFFSKIYIYL